MTNYKLLLKFIHLTDGGLRAEFEEDKVLNFTCHEINAWKVSMKSKHLNKKFTIDKPGKDNLNDEKEVEALIRYIWGLI